MTPEVLHKVNSVFEGLTPHPMMMKYLTSDSQCRMIIKGNQGGGTKSTVLDATLRLLGIHPVKKRNRIEKPVRFITKCLPKNDEDEENQQYVEFKKMFPPELIKKDVTARSSTVIVRDPASGSDRKVEFMSKKQELDAFMSVQRSAFYQDEEIERIKWDENLARLTIPASEGKGGDVSVNLTPAVGLDWMYDLLWKKARVIYRSDTIVEKTGLPAEEITGSESDIEAFCWATDDNPLTDSGTISSLFGHIDDEDELLLRRYGVFRQVAGRIYKSFDTQIHVIPWEKYWNPNKFQEYWHYRIIDYHPAKPWYITWVAVTPNHEWFVWNELKAQHHHATSVELRDQIKDESLLEEDDLYNRATLIDPLAKVKQPNTGFTVFDDISRGEYGLRRCQSADTKNKQDVSGKTSGRMVIKTRLKNALKCGVPFNNDFSVRGDDESMVEDIRYGYQLPTLWFFDTCKGHKEHFSSWRTVDFKQEHVKAVKEVRRESEKWSDFCRNLEFLGAHNPVWYPVKKEKWERSSLFQGQRR